MPESSPCVIIEEVLKMNNNYRYRRLKKESTLTDEMLRHGYAQVYDYLNDCVYWLDPDHFAIYIAKNKQYVDYSVVRHYPWYR